MAFTVYLNVVELPTVNEPPSSPNFNPVDMSAWEMEKRHARRGKHVLEKCYMDDAAETNRITIFKQ